MNSSSSSNNSYSNNNTNINSPSNDKITSELYFLIAHFLNNSPFSDVAKILIQRLEEEKVLPKRYDWRGNEHSRSFNELIEQSKHIPPNFLIQMCNQLRLLMDSHLNNKFSSVNSLLGCGQYSVLQDLQICDKKLNKMNLCSSKDESVSRGLYSKFASKSINLVNNLNERQMNHKINPHQLIQPEFYKACNTYKRILGHLSAVYCVCFDRTGRYILTGADDNLIKIWSAFDGRLLATLRGHDKEISDIDVNFENTLLVSGSCDKTIRVWNLKTIESTTVLQGHSAMVTSVEFSPCCRDENRWMASSGNDGAVCFWQWNAKTLVFNPKPKKFIEKSRSGAQMLCISFSTGGAFLAAGSNDHVIRVYYFENGSPTKICELESHSNFVDSIQYSNHSTRFLSGSKDGTARIWKYERRQWKALLIDASKTLQKPDPDEIGLDMFKKNSVTMVTWNSDDSLVVTAQNNYLIKVWNSNDAHLIHELKGHTDEVYVLEAHPKDPRLLLSAGHDGLIIFWNLLTGKLIRKFYNKIENEGHGCLFDAKWSPLSDMFAATDSHGYLSLFGFGGDDNYKKVPNEQFFHTDYRPLMRDQNDYVIDEQTQQPPHLMPPAFLVNADGHPYSIDYQRLVPGRENLSDLQQNPHVIVNDRGQQEIIGDLANEEENNLSIDDTQLRTQNRRRNLWKKNFIQPLDPIMLRSDEENRIHKSEIEEEYIYSEYQKGSSDFAKHSYDDIQNQNSNNYPKRGRGRGRMSKREKDAATEIVCKNRLTAKALYDTDAEDEPNVDINSDEDSDEYDEFLDVVDDDEDSKQPVVNTRSNAIPTRSTAHNHIEELDVVSDDSDSSEYSDWAEEEGRKTLKPPPSRTRREKRGRRRLRIKEDDEDVEVDVEAEEEFTKITRKIRKARVIHDDDEDKEDAEVVENEQTNKSQNDEEINVDQTDLKDVKPSTSSDVSPRKGRPPKNHKKQQKDKDKNRNKIENRISIHNAVNVNECPPEYRPPEWLTSTKPRKSPYMPQIGDEVVYFKQGHNNYVDAVKNEKVYEIEERSLPWYNSHINIIEYCKVVGLKVEIKPPRLVCLKLNVIDRDTGRLTGNNFSIKYHDMPGIIDFVILRQIFERGEERNWKPKDRFRCIIDDVWWFGVIESKEPLHIDYPDSPFLCYNVVWDNGDHEKLSSWDLEQISLKKSKSVTKGESLPVSTDELKSLIYIPEEYEWPSCGRDAECDRILAGLERIMELSIAEFFNYPVDLDAYPLYAIIICYPIDLNTIKQRLENRYYRRINSIQWDVRIIENNATKFNERKSYIVRQASLLTELLLEFINDPNCTNPIPIYKRLCKQRNYQVNDAIDTSNESNEQMLKNELNTHNANKRNKSHGRRSTYQRDGDAWKEDCKRLIESIMQHADSVPFRSPVDLREFPDYGTIISEPIDFGTIRTKLLNNSYNDLKVFDSDCKLVFSNSKTYNTNKRSRIYGMTLRLCTLYEAKIKEIFDDYNSAMQYKMYMTSRYGRKIKYRYADPNEPNKGLNVTADAESDDARQDFDDNYKLHNNHKTSMPTTSMAATAASTVAATSTIATTSTASNSYDGPMTSNGHISTRSNRRLRSSQSVNFNNNTNNKTATTNGHYVNGTLKRSQTTLEKSYYTKDISESSEQDNDDYDDDVYDDNYNENSNKSNSNNKKQSNNKLSKKNSSNNDVNTNEYTNTNGHFNGIHDEASNSRVSSHISNENHNRTANSNHTNNNHKIELDDVDHESRDKYVEDEDYEEEVDDEEDEEEEEEEEETYSDTETDYKKTRVNKKPQNKTRGKKRVKSTTVSTRTRTSKRNRKQFSYRESTNSSENEDYLSDSCSKKSTASNTGSRRPPQKSSSAASSSSMSLRSTRKKRRYSPAYLACQD